MSKLKPANRSSVSTRSTPIAIFRLDLGTALQVLAIDSTDQDARTWLKKVNFARIARPPINAAVCTFRPPNRVV